jgi:ABC-type transport system involved in multi-copper enzyme maturation permease subunit
VLLAVYLASLSAVVYLAWPTDERLDMTNSAASRQLVNMFFLGQFVFASLLAPSFAAGALTGEKERKTYEMLLASPLRPSAIVLGKLLASLCHLAILVFASLPIVMLCLPLGGTSLYEVLAAYVALIVAVATFGMISLACSSYFSRTSASLVVSYLLILPLVIVGVLFWIGTQQQGATRLVTIITVLPITGAAVIATLFAQTSLRLLYPADIGSEGKEVVNLENEGAKPVGLVIRRDRFPDRLFAPAKRDDLMSDGVNPVFDKEMRSEIFSQGTLMLRLVVQLSLVLAIPIMIVCLQARPEWAPFYIGYVLAFNVLVGPVFSAGSVTSERERETLELLLTTTISPWKIIWGKLLSGLRVSFVLTSLLLFPLLLACLLTSIYWENVPIVIAYVVIISLAALTTSTLALFCSVLFRKTSLSLMTTYVVIGALFFLPPAMSMFSEMFLTDSGARAWITSSRVLSPVAVAFALPIDLDMPGQVVPPADWRLFFSYVGFTLAANANMVVAMVRLFGTRWRVSG